VTDVDETAESGHLVGSC